MDVFLFEMFTIYNSKFYPFEKENSPFPSFLFEMDFH